MDNPQAFPSKNTTIIKHIDKPFMCDDVNESETIGMTLRDYFAGQAVIGMSTHTSKNAPLPDEMAFGAYSVADAMLKERTK